MITMLHESLQQNRGVALVNRTLDAFFECSIDEAAKTSIHTSYERLWRDLYSLFMSGGKRTRSQLVLLSYSAFGGTEIEPIAPIAAAQELLHFSLLIHDDIIDRDYIRYSKPNIAGTYQSHYKKHHLSHDDLQHFSHSAAILAGDLMLSGAYRLVATSNASDAEKTIAHKLLSESIFDVAGGELLDTEASFSPYADGTALCVAHYKTASYSFILPLLTGANLAGANDMQCAALRKYAHALGVAYQLADDILGVFGDESTTGKSTSSDIVEGKRTYLVEKTLAQLSKSEKNVFMHAFGNIEAKPAEIEAARVLFKRSGGLESTRTKISSYAAKARAAIVDFGLEEAAQKPFDDIITQLTERSY